MAKRRDWTINRQGKTGQEGIALILVIWVLAILIAVVASFSYMGRTDIQASYNTKELVKAQFIAEAGVNKAIVEILFKKQKPTDESAWKLRGAVVKADFGEGSYKVRVTPEMAKVDLNFANEILLKGLLQGMGLDEKTQNIIVDSIQDWKDEDDLHRLYGAESEYYMSFKDYPYKPANGPFNAVDELLLVKGVTPALFYGSEGKKGLKDLCTVYSSTSKIDLTTAPKEVLMALPAVTADIADKIIQYRKENDLTHPNQVRSLLPNYTDIQNYIDASGGNTYTIESVGTTKNFGAPVGVRAVVNVAREVKYLYYKTPEVLKLDEEAGK